MLKAALGCRLLTFSQGRKDYSAGLRRADSFSVLEELCDCGRLPACRCGSRRCVGIGAGGIFFVAWGISNISSFSMFWSCWTNHRAVLCCLEGLRRKERVHRWLEPRAPFTATHIPLRIRETEPPKNSLTLQIWQPKPQTLSPKPQARSSKPQTPSPKPKILNPKTQNPKPSTLGSAFEGSIFGILKAGCALNHGLGFRGLGV